VTLEFYGKQIKVIEKPDVVTFMRDFVAQNRPCVIKNAINDWPALKLWNREYLSKILGGSKVQVDVFYLS
jgi:hypothetical protein